MLVCLGAVALAAAFTSSVSAQPAGTVIITDPEDTNLVMQVGTYVISEYYGANNGQLSINSQVFTNNSSRLGGSPYTQDLPYFGATQDDTNLALISYNNVFAGSFDFTVPTVTGHSYVLELLFHDNAWVNTGQRVFSVSIGPLGNTTLAATLDLAALGAGANQNADVLLRYVLDNSSGSPLEIKLHASVNNSLINALALLDVSDPSIPPQLFVGPASQTRYAGSQAAFSCVVAGPSLAYQWQAGAVASSSYTNLADGYSGVSGSLTPTLTVNPLTTNNQADYVVTVTNSAGSVTSAPPATLTVTYVPGMSIIAGPQDPNLLLTGNFLFAEYYGANNGPLSIGGLIFTNDNARLEPANTATENLPNFGATADDQNLALISESDLYSGSGFLFTLPTVTGRSYVLQLLFHDNAYATIGQRLFNINAGPVSPGVQPWVQNLDLVDAGAYQTQPYDVLLTLDVPSSNGSGFAIQLVPAVDNPMLSAMTFQDVSGAPVPPLITGQSTSTNLFVGRTAVLSVVAAGTPLNYQWQSSPTGLNTFTNITDGGNQWGSATATLTITNITLAQSKDYQVVVSNPAGTNTSTLATVTVLPIVTPITAGANYPYAIKTNNAVDYWQLNEPSGSPMVYDYGTLGDDGAAGAGAFLGQPGPQPPDFPGFGNANSALGTVNSNAPTVVASAQNLNTNTVTLLAWLYPTNTQGAGAGVMLSRLGSTGPATGLAYGITLQSFNDYSLRYFWNGVSADSGLQVPQNQWSLVGLVVTSTNATIYVVNASGMSSWTTLASNAACPFSSPFLIGNDTADTAGGRVFAGSIDEVAVFSYALTQNQLSVLFAIATGISVLPPTASAPPALTITNAGANVVLTSGIGGVPTPTAQWMKRPLGLTGPYANVVNGSGISGAQTAVLTINGVSAANMGDYVLAVSNIDGTATSSVGRLLVIQPNNSPALIGQWLTGSQTFADQSGYFNNDNNPQVHTGVAVGSPTWVSGDVPPNFNALGSSLSVNGSSSAVIITNTKVGDLDYRLDYDNNITNTFTIAFWAKNYPTGNWNPWVTKNGESTHGWQFRVLGASGYRTNIPTFTLQGTGVAVDNGNVGSAITIPAQGVWHHYCGTLDCVNSHLAHLYVDGVDRVNMGEELLGVTAANVYHMIIGAKENPGIGNWFNGSFYDVRLYNYAVSPGEVQAMMTPGSQATTGVYFNTTNSTPLGLSVGFSVVIPIGANASAPFTIWITNNSPNVCYFQGYAGNVLQVVFAVGDPTTKSYVLDTIGTGAIVLTASDPNSYTPIIGTAPAVITPAIIGHWLTGGQNLSDTANYVGQYVHDGYASSGTSIGTATAHYANDAPAAFLTPNPSLYCLDLTANNYAVTISNSSTLVTGSTPDANYQPTFDDKIANAFSVTFWAKGPIGSWNPWVSKQGDVSGAHGWSVRQHGGDSYPSFTLRDTPDNPNADPANSANLVNAFGSPTFQTSWHHFAATYDGQAGVRKLYIDGQMSASSPQDYGPMGVAYASYLTLGGVDNCSADLTAAGNSSPNIGSYFVGKLFDVRMYNYPLGLSEIQAIMAPANAAAFTAAADTPALTVGDTGTISFSLPAGANASQSITVTVNNGNPSALSIVGAPPSPFTLTFPAGAYPTEKLPVTGLSQGAATITVSAPGFTSASATVNVYAKQLVGHWIVGAQSLAEVSGFMPAGTHDGFATGTPSSLAYATGTGNVPTGFKGYSILFNQSYAVRIMNSSAVIPAQPNSAGYQPTFDDLLNNHMTIAFWLKATTGAQANNSTAFVSKCGTTYEIGYQVRRNGSTADADFTIRQDSWHGFDEDTSGAITVMDGNWHHVAAVYDGAAGTRQVYVDGALDSGINLVGDFGPYTMARNHYLDIGSDEQNIVSAPASGNNGYLSGNMYDVRIYNYALSQSAVQALTVPSAPTLTIQQISATQVQLSWSTSYGGYSVLTSSSVTGPWGAASLTVTSQNGQFVATDTIGAGDKFYLLTGPGE